MNSGSSKAADAGIPKRAACLIAGLVALAVLTGCASTEVTGRERLVHEKLPKPNQILVYDFTATPADIPANSVLAGEKTLDATPQTPEQVEAGRKLGLAIAVELAGLIRDMGLQAEVATAGLQPQIKDIVIRGHLLSIKEGSATKRVAIGFGSGASELRTLVEGFQMTPLGLRKLGSGTVDAGGSKGPGAAVGVAAFLATANPVGLIVGTGTKIYGEASGKSTVEGRAKSTAKEIADVLKKRFQEEGWIAP